MSRPGWIYGVGEYPDYRFTLANERTFLAWFRTALGLLAAAAVLASVPIAEHVPLGGLAAAFLTALAVVMAVAAAFRWALIERRMRLGTGLPSLVPYVVVATAVPLSVALALVISSVR